MTRLLFLLGMLLVPFFAHAENLPLQPPCGVPPAPAYGVPGLPPSVDIWNEARLSQVGWRAPECLKWGHIRTRFAIALAGEFRFSGSFDQLLERASGISEHKSIRYWSVTDKAWRNLVSDAGVVDGPNGQTVLPDFTPAHLVTGKSFHFFEVSRSSRTTYRLTVLERTADRLVLATENVTPIRLGPLTVFDPGSLQWVAFLEKRGTGIWGYYQLIRAGEGASALALGRESSYVNRLAALYRHMAGLRTDSEPPTAR